MSISKNIHILHSKAGRRSGYNLNHGRRELTKQSQAPLRIQGYPILLTELRQPAFPMQDSAEIISYCNIIQADIIIVDNVWSYKPSGHLLLVRVVDGSVGAVCRLRGLISCSTASSLYDRSPNTAVQSVFGVQIGGREQGLDYIFNDEGKRRASVSRRREEGRVRRSRR